MEVRNDSTRVIEWLSTTAQIRTSARNLVVGFAFSSVESEIYTCFLGKQLELRMLWPL